MSAKEQIENNVENFRTHGLSLEVTEQEWAYLEEAVELQYELLSDLEDAHLARRRLGEIGATLLHIALKALAKIKIMQQATPAEGLRDAELAGKGNALAEAIRDALENYED